MTRSKRVLLVIGFLISIIILLSSCLQYRIDRKIDFLRKHRPKMFQEDTQYIPLEVETEGPVSVINIPIYDSVSSIDTFTQEKIKFQYLVDTLHDSIFIKVECPDTLYRYEYPLPTNDYICPDAYEIPTGTTLLDNWLFYLLIAFSIFGLFSFVFLLKK